MSQKSKRISIILILFSLLSVGLFYFRGLYSGVTPRYFFLNWNLFLAWIPVFLSWLTYLRFRKKKKLGLLFLAVSIVWLLFYPNSSYVLTDLIHLKQKDNIPIWFDLIMILSYAIVSLYLGFISLMWMQHIVERTRGKKISWLFATSVLALASFGVYLGRFERWNSWDIVVTPMDLIRDVFDRFIDPFAHPRTIGFTAIFFVFSLLSYLFIHTLSESNNKLEV